MAFYAAGPIPLLFDFNVVITNLNKMDKAEAMELVSTLCQSIQSSAELNEGYHILEQTLNQKDVRVFDYSPILVFWLCGYSILPLGAV